MIEIELNNIKKNYGLKNVLDGVSFEIKTGQKVALIGENGSGKSTILKIINKEENVDEGKLNIKKDASICFLKQQYNNEKEDYTVESYLKQSFEEYTKIENKLKELEVMMANDLSNAEILLKKYGNLQEKYITIRRIWIRRKI